MHTIDSTPTPASFADSLYLLSTCLHLDLPLTHSVTHTQDMRARTRAHLLMLGLRDVRGEIERDRHSVCG